MFYSGGAVFSICVVSCFDFPGISGEDIHDFQTTLGELGADYFEGEAKRGNPGDVGYLGVGA